MKFKPEIVCVPKLDDCRKLKNRDDKNVMKNCQKSILKIGKQSIKLLNNHIEHIITKKIQARPNSTITHNKIYLI